VISHLYSQAKYKPFGDKALIVEFGNAINPEINRKVHALHEALANAHLLGICECVPTYCSLLIIFDPLRLACEDAVAAVKKLEHKLDVDYSKRKPRKATIPVVYGSEFGPDLPVVADYHGLSEREVIEVHAEREYLVYMIGFIVGFPYLGELEDRIATPRHETPRIRVPEGSVGIAEKQTGIYPREAPGGWQIIGRTPLKLFDPSWPVPTLLQAGDLVKFKPISTTEFQRIRGKATHGENKSSIMEQTGSVKLFRVIKSGFFTTVQDLGRAGFLRFGVPTSGAMDDFSFQLANMLVGNSPNDACLEITVIGPELEALSAAQIAICGGDLSPLVNDEKVAMWHTTNIEKGDVVSFEKFRNGCRAYLSVRGGVNVPVVLGSRSTYTRGQLGGVEGRQLKKDDILGGFESAKILAHGLAVPNDLIPDFNSEIHVNVLLGPHLDRFTLKGVETFLSSPYVVTLEAVRMGYRTEGPIIELKTKGEVISDAILPGAVQVPSDGKPIVMMKDAQTTGGYAKIAAVVTSDIHVLGQAKPNDTVHFHKVSLAEAHDGLHEYQEKLKTMRKKLISTRV